MTPACYLTQDMDGREKSFSICLSDRIAKTKKSMISETSVILTFVIHLLNTHALIFLFCLSLNMKRKIYTLLQVIGNKQTKTQAAGIHTEAVSPSATQRILKKRSLSQCYLAFASLLN